MKSLSKFILLIVFLLTTSLSNSTGGADKQSVLSVSDLSLPHIENSLDSNVKKESKELKILLDKTQKELSELKQVIRTKRVQDSLLIEYYATY